MSQCSAERKAGGGLRYCIQDRGHSGAHRDVDGVCWGGAPAPDWKALSARLAEALRETRRNLRCYEKNDRGGVDHVVREALVDADAALEHFDAATKERG